MYCEVFKFLDSSYACLSFYPSDPISEIFFIYHVERSQKIVEIKRHNELKQQKLLLPSLLVYIYFVNHEKSRRDEILKYIFKDIMTT